MDSSLLVSQTEPQIFGIGRLPNDLRILNTITLYQHCGSIQAFCAFLEYAESIISQYSIPPAPAITRCQPSCHTISHNTNHRFFLLQAIDCFPYQRWPMTCGFLLCPTRFCESEVLLPILVYTVSTVLLMSSSSRNA